MQSRVLNALAALLLLLPLSGRAAEFGYSFVDFAIIPDAEVDSGESDFDGDGFQLRGSIDVQDNFFAVVEIEDLGFDDDVDFTRWLIGGGGHWPINATMEVIGRAGIVRYEVDQGPFDDDDTSFFFGGRLRAQVAARVEVEGGIEFVNTEVVGFGDEIFLVGEGRYHFNNQFSVGGLLNIGDDAKKIGVYGRYNF
jgi:hypothetical protein